MEKTDKLKAIEKNETEKKNEMNDITKMPFINDLLDSLPNCLTIVDEDRHIYFANNKFLDFIGEDNIVNVLGVRIGNAFNCEIAVKYGECGKNLECAFCSSLASITEAVNTKKLDVRESSMTIIKNGHLESLDLKVYSTPTVIEGKKYIIFTFEDISHEKRRRVLERIFFHDIIKTIGGVIGFAELLKSSKDSDEIKENSSYIFEYSNRVLDEVLNQKFLLGAENNNLTLKLDRVNVLEFLTDVKNIFEKSDVGRGRKLQIDEIPEKLRMTTDSVLLGRVLGNMIINALEACKFGETVRIGCELQDEIIKFSVNNPAYLESAVQMQIFNRSFSTKDADRGLGTYSMRLLSERYLKGRVYFSTSQSEGTTFYAEFNHNFN